MAPGTWSLYWPNEVFKPNTELVHPLDPVFKLPLIPPALESTLVSPLPVDLQCHELLLGENPTGTTTTAVSTKAAESASGLHSIKLAPKLLENLQVYIDLKKDDNKVTTRTFGPRKLPPAEQQSKQITKLSRWFSHHSTLKSEEDCIVSSEESVRAQLCSQVVTPINYLLNMRYEWAQLSSHQDNAWQHCTEKLKKKMVAAMSSKTRGGIPDFVLPAGALCEVKTAWALTELELAGIFCDPDFIQDNGNVNAHFKDKKFNKLITQIWTELSTHGSRWGFFSNGRMVFTFCRTGPNELAISENIPWESKKLHMTLLGLSFAAIDVKLMPKSNQDSLITKICGNLIAPFNDENYKLSKLFVEARKQRLADVNRQNVPSEPSESDDAEESRKKLSKAEWAEKQEYARNRKIQPSDASPAKLRTRK